MPSASSPRVLMWKLEYWCMTVRRARQAEANRAQTFGVVTVAGRPVRSKKSTSNGSVSVSAYSSQSCRSRPRPKRSMTSLICWRSHSWRTISSAGGQLGGVAGGGATRADLVVELAVGAEPPDDVGHGHAPDAGQRDLAPVLGGDAPADPGRGDRRAVRADGPSRLRPHRRGSEPGQRVAVSDDNLQRGLVLAVQRLGHADAGVVEGRLGLPQQGGGALE